MIDQLKPLIGKLTIFAKDRMGFQHPPRLFLKSDSSNSKKMLGKTAYYDPQEKAITLFTHNRHPKDILRSYAHELVHHTQNLRGDLSPEKCGEMGDGYAQASGHMREMEREAYEKGNMCFRDWEDTLSDKETYIIIKIAESKFIKENKTMTKKITKEFLKNTIREALEKQINEQGDATLKFSTEEKKAIRNAPSIEAARAAAKKMLKAKGFQGSDALKAVGQIVRAFYNSEGMKADGTKYAKDSSGSDKSAVVQKVKEENEELEEGPMPMINEPEGVDLNDDGNEGSGKVPAFLKKEGSQIQTPEQENTLYEQRFTPKNNRLFEKLVKQWTK